MQGYHQKLLPRKQDSVFQTFQQQKDYSGCYPMQQIEQKPSYYPSFVALHAPKLLPIQALFQ